MRRLGLKLVLLSSVVIGLHAAINHGKTDFELAERLEGFGVQGIDVLLMGDSVVHRYVDSDSDQRTLIDMQLAALRRLAAKASAKNVGTVFYVTPLDGERLESLQGDWIMRQIAENVMTIREELSRVGVTLVDFSRILPTEAFENHNGIDEHLAELGRKELSRRLLAALGSVDQ